MEWTMTSATKSSKVYAAKAFSAIARPLFEGKSYSDKLRLFVHLPLDSPLGNHPDVRQMLDILLRSQQDSVIARHFK